MGARERSGTSPGPDCVSVGSVGRGLARAGRAPTADCAAVHAVATFPNMQLSAAFAHIRAVAPALGLAVLMAACSASGGTGSPAGVATSSAPVAPSSKYPNAIAVLGHSGATGFGSDPKRPLEDARTNSWATGDNPEVNSIYLRLLALNPAVRGHNVNFAEDGTGVNDLAGQADQALNTQPLPDLFLIQSVDNDMRCDGTDAQNYGPFAAALTDVLKKITAAAPKAKILLVSSPPGTVENYGKIAAKLDVARKNVTGTGMCDLFDAAGKPVPAHWRASEAITLHYLDQLKAVCVKFPACQYDNGALYHMPITAEDLAASDGAHLSLSGHRKQAELEWRVLGIS
jgi:hypothetical protein